jgi:hypothetical protein
MSRSGPYARYNASGRRAPKRGADSLPGSTVVLPKRRGGKCGKCAPLVSCLNKWFRPSGTAICFDYFEALDRSAKECRGQVGNGSPAPDSENSCSLRGMINLRVSPAWGHRIRPVARAPEPMRNPLFLRRTILHRNMIETRSRCSIERLDLFSFFGQSASQECEFC